MGGRQMKYLSPVSSTWLRGSHELESRVEMITLRLVAMIVSTEKGKGEEKGEGGMEPPSPAQSGASSNRSQPEPTAQHSPHRHRPSEALPQPAALDTFRSNPALSLFRIEDEARSNHRLRQITPTEHYRKMFYAVCKKGAGFFIHSCPSQMSTIITFTVFHMLHSPD